MCVYRCMYHLLRYWRNTAEIVLLLETSNLMKPYPSVVHAHSSKLRPAKSWFEPNDFDEVSNRIRQPLIYIYIYIYIYMHTYIHT